MPSYAGQALPGQTGRSLVSLQRAHPEGSSGGTWYGRPPGRARHIAHSHELSVSYSSELN